MIPLKRGMLKFDLFVIYFYRKFRMARKEKTLGYKIKSIIRIIYVFDITRLLEDSYKIGWHDYVSILGGRNKLEEKLLLYAICIAFTQKEEIRHLKKTLFTGLGTFTKNKLIRQNLLYNLEGAWNYLVGIEKTLISESNNLTVMMQPTHDYQPLFVESILV